MTPQGKRVLGIIAEYNPFHNGHLYHMEEARRRSGCDYLIVVMSGDYVQRGAPALFDKYTRARFALEAGADAVLELPAALACGSAEFFARGAVGLLHRLGIVDCLCFGCEDTDLSSLQCLAELLAEEPAAYREALARLLCSGKGYPAARQEALLGLVPAETAALLAKPNNLLAIEYLKALSFFSSSIKPLPLKRKGSSYHDIRLVPGQTGTEPSFPSATALRRQIFSIWKETPNHREDFLAPLKPYLPDFVYSLLQEHFFPIQEDDFSSALFYALQPYSRTISQTCALPQAAPFAQTASPKQETGLTRLEKQEWIASLAKYQDISTDLAGRMLSCLHGSFSFSTLAARLSASNYTASRIRRALLHLLLGITSQDMELFRDCSYAPYVRLLGIKKESGTLFRLIAEERRIPVITKVADAKRLLTPEALYLLEQDIAAAELYNQAVFCRYGRTIPSDYYYPFLTR